jgi:phosphoglycerate dehydrogenase-like enzyme
MPQTHVLLWTDGPGPYIDAIAAAGLSDRVHVEAVPRGQSLNQAQRASTEAMLAWNAPAGLLPDMPKLRWAQALTAGVEMWLSIPDLPPALTLTCARGTHRESMPENILGGLFHLTKPYALANQDQKASTWVRRMATPLSGQTLGILGLGEIGQRVARLANALGMRVIGTKRTPGQADDVAAVLPTSRTDEVLAQSDFVLLLLPATPETENFINAERLRQMKPSAYLLNFGRGALIDDAALIAAVREKTIAGAVLDVFRQEPLPKEHPFWTTDGIQVLPHIGGGHPRRDSVVAKLFVDNLGRFLDGKPLLQEVDRLAGY